MTFPLSVSLIQISHFYADASHAGFRAHSIPVCDFVLTWLHLQRPHFQIRSHSQVLGRHCPTQSTFHRKVGLVFFFLKCGWSWNEFQERVCADLVGAVSDAAPSPAPVTVRGSALLSRVVARCRGERLVSPPSCPVALRAGRWCPELTDLVSRCLCRPAEHTGAQRGELSFHDFSRGSLLWWYLL